MPRVGMVQVAGHQIIHVIPMRHGGVATARPMHMLCIVSGAGVIRRAPCGIGIRHLDPMLVDVIVMRVMQMPVMQEVDVIAVAHANVAATRTVDMTVLGVGVGGTAHGDLLARGWVDSRESAARKS